MQPQLNRLRRRLQPRFDRRQLEDRIPAGQKAAFLVLGILLPRQPAKVGANLPPESDLFKIQAPQRDQLAFLLGQGRLLHRPGPVAPLQPPGKEVPRHPCLAGLPPLLVKASAYPVRRRLQDQLRPRSQRRAQPGKGFSGIAGPARQLRAVQILHRQSPSRVPIAGRHHPILRVHLGKDDLPHIGPRSPQRPLPQLVRQPVHKPVYDPEDLLGSLLGVRHLQGQCPRLGDRLQKKTRRRPGRQSHLPRLQHDVPLPPPPLECLLRSVRLQRRRPPFARPYKKKFLGQRHRHRPPPEAGRALVQDPAELFQLLPVQLRRPTLQIPSSNRAFSPCFRHRPLISTSPVSAAFRSLRAKRISQPCHVSPSYPPTARTDNSSWLRRPVSRLRL